MLKLSVRLHAFQEGGHTRVWVYAGADEEHRANCGDLKLRNEEWELLEVCLSEASTDKVQIVLTGDRLEDQTVDEFRVGREA